MLNASSGTLCRSLACTREETGACMEGQQRGDDATRQDRPDRRKRTLPAIRHLDAYKNLLVYRMIWRSHSPACHAWILYSPVESFMNTTVWIRTSGVLVRFVVSMMYPASSEGLVSATIATSW